jgi:hypothetical protein
MTTECQTIRPIGYALRYLSQLALCAFVSLWFIALPLQTLQAQDTPKPQPYRIGEKFTYNVSFSKYPTAAYAEMQVTSRGKYDGRDAILLQSKVKSNEFVSAAFFLVDETRQTLVSPDTGLPFFCKKVNNESGFAKEKAADFKGNAASFDLLSAVYQIRFAPGGNGSLSIQDDEKAFQAAFQNVGKEKIKTDAGEFETNAIDVQGAGFQNLRINISDDDRRIPVQFSFMLPKGRVKAQLASLQIPQPEADPKATPTPAATPFPRITPTPRPTPAPRSYTNNEPLPADFPFVLGETLSFNVSRPGQDGAKGKLLLHAKQRRQFFGQDSLHLVAAFKEVANGTPFSPGDTFESYVQPESLLPYRTEAKFKGAAAQYNQTLAFNQQVGRITSSAGSVEAPMGTHDLLSLAYAVRIFNLREFKRNAENNKDTRVSVAVGSGPVVMTIISQPDEMIDFEGAKVEAQVALVNLNQTLIKAWIGKDNRRLPLKLAVTGALFNFQLDLASVGLEAPTDRSTEVSLAQPRRPGIIAPPAPVNAASAAKETPESPNSGFPSSEIPGIPSNPQIIQIPTDQMPMSKPIIIPYDPNNPNPTLGPPPTTVMPNPVPPPNNPTVASPQPNKKP